MNTKDLQTSLYPNIFWSSNYLAKKVDFFLSIFFSSANFILWNCPWKRKRRKREMRHVVDMTEFARCSSTPEKMSCKLVPPQLSPRSDCTWFVAHSSPTGMAVLGTDQGADHPRGLDPGMMPAATRSSTWMAFKTQRHPLVFLFCFVFQQIFRMVSTSLATKCFDVQWLHQTHPSREEAQPFVALSFGICFYLIFSLSAWGS